MNLLAIIFWVTVGLTVVVISVVWPILAVEHRRRRVATVEADAREERADPVDLRVELAEQRRELTELRGEVERLRSGLAEAARPAG